MTIPTPAPYPTPPGNAVPNAWQCDVIFDGTTEYEQCSVTSWQMTNPEPVPTVTQTVTAEPSGEPAMITTGIVDQASYGNWSGDWNEFLVGAVLTTAAALLLVALYMVWARKAIKND